MLFLLNRRAARKVERTETLSGRINLKEVVFVVVNVAAQIDDFDAFVASWFGE